MTWFADLELVSSPSFWVCRGSRPTTGVTLRTLFQNVQSPHRPPTSRPPRLSLLGWGPEKTFGQTLAPKSNSYLCSWLSQNVTRRSGHPVRLSVHTLYGVEFELLVVVDVTRNLNLSVIPHHPWHRLVVRTRGSFFTEGVDHQHSSWHLSDDGQKI